MRTFIVVFAFLFSIYSSANIRLPKLFADDMVLQRNQPIPIWGWADDASDNNLYNKEGFPAVLFRIDTWKKLPKTLNIELLCNMVNL